MGPKTCEKMKKSHIVNLPLNTFLADSGYPKVRFWVPDPSLIIYAYKLHPKWLTFHVNGSNASKLSDNINRNKTSLKNCIPTAL